MSSTATPPVEMPGEQMSGARAQDSDASGGAPPATPADRQEADGLLPFFPNYVLDEVIAWYIVLGLLIFLASLLPAGLEEKADALRTPPHIKPEWYFLALYQALKLVPRTIGILAPMIGIVVLFFLPFIDRNPEVRPRKRPLAVAIAVIVLIFAVVFTVWGSIS